MTPKEKAQEIYDKYEFVYIQNYTSKHEVKQCALIAVDDLIAHWQEYGDNYYAQQLKWWTEVKQEIEKI